MHKHIRNCLAVCAMLSSFNGFAASDPVSWSLTPSSGFPTTPVDGQSIVTYTLVSHLPGAAVMLTQIRKNSDALLVQDGCNGVTLNPGQQCRVLVRFNPVKAGEARFQLTYGYHNNRIPLPELVARAAGEEPQVGLSGVISAPNPFPSTFFDNQSPQVVADFVNTGNTPLTGCKGGNSAGAEVFSLTPASAATVVNNVPQPDTCGSTANPVTLAPGEHCFLYAQLTSLKPTPNVTLNAQVSCEQAQATTPSKTFSIESSGGQCTTVSVQTLLPLPVNTYRYADNVVQFGITNTCASDNVGLGVVSVTSNTTPAATVTTINGTYDKCSNQTLAPGETCTVMASVIPNAVGPMTITARVTPAGGVETTGATSATVASNQQPTHHILFVNQCKFDVWYGIANGTGANCPGPNCLSPDPSSGATPSAYHLPAQVTGQPPSVIDLSVASYQNGAFWPRTGCVLQNGQLNCATGTCATLPNSGTCNSTGSLVQPQAPFTKFEANLNPAPGTDGIYDVSAINGMTVPVEVKGFGPLTGNTASTVYNCSAAGALMQPASNNNLGNCSWNYDPSSTLPGAGSVNDFYWVTPGADDDCSSSSLPSLCGMAWNQGPTPTDFTGKTPINRRLGAFLGFNTLDVYAAYTVLGTNNATWGSVNEFTKYGLNIQIPGQSAASNYGTIPNQVIFPGNTYLSWYALIGCPAVSSTSALNSCYQTPVNNDFAKCCGCVNWSNTLPAHACGYASQGQYTDGMNTDWTGSTGTTIPAPAGSYTPEQAVAWIKNACPTAYAYTYDDPSSSFSCTKDGDVNLYTSYQVTFCPGGVSGLPEGAAEGRAIAP